jgi:myo-inositol-1(or 4)-monophosphatase
MAAPDRRFSAPEADWLGVCRRAAKGVRAALERHPRTADRARVTGRGEGGDKTLAIDQAAEDAVMSELEALGLPLTAVSEELGEVPIAGGGPARVVIDPIDGSLNAKRGLPFYSLSIAVAGGAAMADVELGYVVDLASGQEWWARRGEGVFCDDERLPPLEAGGPLEVLGIESAHPRYVADAAEALAATGAARLRAIGSIALALCLVAAGRLDAMLSLRSARSVDAAAGQLLVREAGGVVAFPDAGEPVGLDLGMRSRVVAATGPELLELVLARVTA